MDSARAFEILGLSYSATEAEIEERYRDLAREMHPDVGGSEDEMRRLNLARDVAKKSVKPGTLVPLEAAKSLIVASSRAIAEHNEAREEARQAEEAAKRSATSAVRWYKDMSVIFGGISAAALFLGKDLPDTFFRGAGVSESASRTFIMTALTTGMFAASAFWHFSRRVTSIEQQIDDLRQHVSTRSGFVTVWLSITDSSSDSDGWTLAELQALVADWGRTEGASEQADDWKSLARLIGESDFTHLLLAKGKELELLGRTEAVEGRSLIERYRLRLHAGERPTQSLNRTDTALSHGPAG